MFKAFLSLGLFFIWTLIFVIFTSNAYIKIGPYDLLTYITDTNFDTRLQRVLEYDRERFNEKIISFEIPGFLNFSDTIWNIPIRTIISHIDVQDFQDFTLSPYQTFKTIWNEQVYFVKDIEYDIFLEDEAFLEYLAQQVNLESFPLAYTENFFIDEKLGLVSILWDTPQINWNTRNIFPYLSLEVRLKRNPGSIRLYSNLPNEAATLEDFLVIENTIEGFYNSYQEQILNPRGLLRIQIGDSILIQRYNTQYFSDYIEVHNDENLYFSYNENKAISLYNTLATTDSTRIEIERLEPISIEGKEVTYKTYTQLSLQELQSTFESIINDDIFKNHTLVLKGEYGEERKIFNYRKNYNFQGSLEFCEYLNTINGNSIISKPTFSNESLHNLTRILHDNDVLLYPETIIGERRERRQDFLIDYQYQDISFIQDDFEIVCLGDTLSFLSQQKYPKKEYFGDIIPFESYIYTNSLGVNIYKEQK